MSMQESSYSLMQDVKEKKELGYTNVLKESNVTFQKSALNSTFMNTLRINALCLHNLFVCSYFVLSSFRTC